VTPGERAAGWLCPLACARWFSCFAAVFPSSAGWCAFNAGSSKLLWVASVGLLAEGLLRYSRFATAADARISATPHCCCCRAPTCLVRQLSTHSLASAVEACVIVKRGKHMSAAVAFVRTEPESTAKRAWGLAPSPQRAPRARTPPSRQWAR